MKGTEKNVTSVGAAFKGQGRALGIGFRNRTGGIGTRNNFASRRIHSGARNRQRRDGAHIFANRKAAAAAAREGAPKMFSSRQDNDDK